jgi:hypothetical protein
LVPPLAGGVEALAGCTAGLFTGDAAAVEMALLAAREAGWVAAVGAGTERWGARDTTLMVMLRRPSATWPSLGADSTE